MIELLKDPSGERVSKIKIFGLTIGIFLIVVLPIAYYMNTAKAERERMKEENSKILVNGETPAAQANNIAEQFKEKSANAVDSITTDKYIGRNSERPDDSSAYNGQQTPSVTQEQRPPMANNAVPSVNSAANPITSELNSQKLDRVKRLYDGVNAPISLGSQYLTGDGLVINANNGNAKNLNPSNVQDTQPPIVSKQSTSPSNQGIGLGGGSNSGGFSGMFPQSNSQNQDADQNKQDEKRAFLANAAGGDADSVTNPNRVMPMKSKYTLLAGDFIPSIMISGLNSDTPGQVIAQVNTNIYDTVSGKYLLIPKASRLIGIYDSKVAYMQKRIVVAWKRVIFPDGKSFLLQGLPGTDLAGYSGFYNEEGIDNHYWQIFGSSFIMGVITGALQLSQNNTNANTQAGGNDFTNNSPSAGQTISGSLGQQLGQTGLAIVNKGLQIQPTITIPPGYEFNIMLTADLILAPYTKQYK